MKYAVVKINGSQFKVTENDKIEIDRSSWPEGKPVVLEEVLLLVEDNKVKIGKPILKEVKVQANVEKHFKGEKLDIYKFKAKTGYRRKIGFRSQKTLLTIEKITS